MSLELQSERQLQTQMNLRPAFPTFSSFLPSTEPSMDEIRTRQEDYRRVLDAAAKNPVKPVGLQHREQILAQIENPSWSSQQANIPNLIVQILRYTTVIHEGFASPAADVLVRDRRESSEEINNFKANYETSVPLALNNRLDEHQLRMEYVNNLIACERNGHQSIIFSLSTHNPDQLSHYYQVTSQAVLAYLENKCQTNIQRVTFVVPDHQSKSLFTKVLNTEDGDNFVTIGSHKEAATKRKEVERHVSKANRSVIQMDGTVTVGSWFENWGKTKDEQSRNKQLALEMSKLAEQSRIAAIQKNSQTSTTTPTSAPGFLKRLNIRKMFTRNKVVQEEVHTPNPPFEITDSVVPNTPLPIATDDSQAEVPATPLIHDTGINLTQEPFDACFNYYVDSPSPNRETEAPQETNLGMRPSQIPGDAVLMTQHGTRSEIPEVYKQAYNDRIERRNSLSNRNSSELGALATPAAQKRRKRTPSRTNPALPHADRTSRLDVHPSGTQQSDSSTDSAIEWAREHRIDPEIQKQLKRKANSRETRRRDHSAPAGPHSPPANARILPANTSPWVDSQPTGVPTFQGKDRMKAFSFLDISPSSDQENDKILRTFDRSPIEPLKKRKDERNSIEKQIPMPNYFHLESQQAVPQKLQPISSPIEVAAVVHYDQYGRSQMDPPACSQNFDVILNDDYNRQELNNFDDSEEIGDYSIQNVETESIHHLSSSVGQALSVLHSEYSGIQLAEEPIVLGRPSVDLDDSLGSLGSIEGSQELPSNQHRADQQVHAPDLLQIEDTAIETVEDNFTDPSQSSIPPTNEQRSDASDSHNQKKPQFEVHEFKSENEEHLAYIIKWTPDQESSDTRDQCYKYIYKGFAKDGKSYVCACCFEISTKNGKLKEMPQVTVNNLGIFIDDPLGIIHCKGCKPLDFNKDLSAGLLYTMTEKDVDTTQTGEQNTEQKLDIHKEPAMGKKHPVYIVKVPNTGVSAANDSDLKEECWRYGYNKKLKDKTGDVFVCLCCVDARKLRDKEKRKTANITARMRVMNDGTFEIDPKYAVHDPECQPKGFLDDVSRRVLYTMTQKIKAKEIVEKPYTIHVACLKMANHWANLSNKDRIKVIEKFGNLDQHSSTYRKANQSLSTVPCQMGAIPEHIILSQIRDETTEAAEQEKFVQIATNKRLVCFCPQMFRLAKEREIAVIVADGTHGVTPRELNGNGQLYTIHGISPKGISVPLINFVLASKTTDTYKSVFNTLKKQLEIAKFDVKNLIFITDFERAAINAIEHTFPDSAHEGCSFHYWRCLLRARHDLLKHYMGTEKDAKVWFSRLQALTFFPQQYLKLTGLLEPPPGVSNEAQQEIKEFLKYFTSNWLEGQNNYKWNKFMRMKNRTTNMAENYNGRFKGLKIKRVAHPPLETLITTMDAMYLKDFQNLKTDKRDLRKIDARRQQAIEGLMTAFSNRMQEVGIMNIPKEEMYEYLDKAAHFIPTTLK